MAPSVLLSLKARRGIHNLYTHLIHEKDERDERREYVPMKTFTTWREFLGSQLRTQQDLQHIAHSLDVHPQTVRRWIEHSSMLPRILALFPEQHALLLSLITQDFPMFLGNGGTRKKVEEDEKTLSPVFYHEVLTQLTQVPFPQRFQAIREHILRHIHTHIGEQDKTQVILSLCTPPSSDARVHSLWERICVGAHTPESLSHRKFFLGAEAVEGYVVTHGHPVTIHDSEEASLVPPSKRTTYRSMIVYSIRRSDRIAGTLTIASSRPHAFGSSTLRLIEHCTTLLSLACEEWEFYPIIDMQLWVMPSCSLQESILDHCWHRVQTLSRKQPDEAFPLTNVQIALFAWQRMEKELALMVFNEQGDAKRESSPSFSKKGMYHNVL